MKYAVIDLGGKQFMVEEGTKFHMEYKDAPEAKVLFYRDGDQFMIGQPALSDVVVTLKKESDYTVKTEITRFKSKSRYRRLKGHKQPMSIISVEKIVVKGDKK
jgi:large subunit ribosomal protein L21